MTLLKLCHEQGLHPKRTAATKGGEYHCPCPACGGTDRFAVWPNEGSSGRYWCRRCKRNGDSIQFCRDFLGMSFSEAKRYIGEWDGISHFRDRPADSIAGSRADTLRLPESSWVESAEKFVEEAHSALISNPPLLERLQKERGLTKETTRMRRIGWNSHTRDVRRSEWGLSERDKKKLYLPLGFVLPVFDFENGSVSRVRVRRDGGFEQGKYGKYHEVSGGSNIMPMYGFRSNTITVVVEAEFDAMLIQQEIDAVSVVALTGAGKTPDTRMKNWMLSRRLILFAPDWDEAGKAQYHKWKSQYPNLQAWPVPREKSPCDAYLAGVDLKEWVLAGINNYLFS